jgi:double zinc ribbon protein
MTSPLSPHAVCAACGTEGSGRFCANCGATLASTTCAGCEAPLSPGAHFCHRCGKPVSAGGRASSPTRQDSSRQPAAASSLPWAVAAIALLALLAMSAGKFFNASRGSSLDAPQNALPQAGLDDRGAAPTNEGAPTNPGIRAPDISALSPEERAERLFNRVMLLNSQGKSDSVLFFAPMAISAYEMISPLTADQRYDMGRIAEVAGALPLAKAQADTILSASPNHLLGLILAARIASLSGDTAARRRYETKFLAVEKTESARKLPEYRRHQDDITSALTNARRSIGSKG